MSGVPKSWLWLQGTQRVILKPRKSYLSTTFEGFFFSLCQGRVSGLKFSKKLFYVSSFFLLQERRTSQEPNEDHLEYSLPYGWKKIAIRRQGHQFRWDFYIIAPCGMRLRSNPEVDRYLENNPKVKCDRRVTNTSRQWPGSGPENLKRVTKAQSPDRNYLGKFFFVIIYFFHFLPRPSMTRDHTQYVSLHHY